jgi:hypothetical protein
MGQRPMLNLVRPQSRQAHVEVLADMAERLLSAFPFLLEPARPRTRQAPHQVLIEGIALSGDDGE